MNATTAELAWPETESNQNRIKSKHECIHCGTVMSETESDQNRACHMIAQLESITLVLQIVLLKSNLLSSNQIESTTMHVPQSNHTTTTLTCKNPRSVVHSDY